MAYRGDDAGTGALEAPTAAGLLRVELGPRRVTLVLGVRTVQIANTFVTIIDGKKQESIKLDGRLIVARDVPHEDLGIWLEVVGKQPGMRRIFGAEPRSLLEADGLAALQRLDAVAHRVRVALGEQAGDVRRAVEIGRGLDKVLLADHGDFHALYARRLFRDRARLALTVYPDGRVVVPDGPEIAITDRFGITVRGDYVRFADKHGTDLARISIPWIALEDRQELARRIGMLVDRS
jgi:hypothetical protein